MQNEIKITTFGKFQVLHGKTDVLENYCKSQKACEIFRYLLAFYGRKIEKENLSELFWPGMGCKRARQNLSSTIYFVRNAFDTVVVEGFGKKILPSSSQMCWFELTGNTYYDVAELKNEIALANQSQSKPEKITHLMNAEAIYKGDFMCEDSYNDWVKPLRSEFREIAINTLTQLIRLLYEERDYNESMFYTIRLLDIDPYNENAIYNKVKLLQLQGRPTEAIRVYEEYEEILKRKFNIKPGRNLEELLESIKFQSDSPVNDFTESTGKSQFGNIPIPKGSILVDMNTFLVMAKHESLKRNPQAFVVCYKIDSGNSTSYESVRNLTFSFLSILRKGDIVTNTRDNIYILLAEVPDNAEDQIVSRFIVDKKIQELLEKLQIKISYEIYSLKNSTDFILLKSTL